MAENLPHWATEARWRTGRKIGRTIYAIADLNGRPSDHDVLIGVMDAIELAEEAVRGHNALIGAGQV